MSEHRRWTPRGTTVLGALLLLGGAMPAAAQDRARVPTAAEQRSRVTRFAVELRRAEERVARARAAVLEGVALDTIRDGALFVLVERGDREVVTVAAARAAAMLDRAYGSAASRLADEPMVIRRASARGVDGDTARLLAVSRWDGVLQPFEGEDATTVAGQLARSGIGRMRALMDRELQLWIGTYGTSSGRPSSLVAAFEELATSPSPLGRRCLIGDVAACRDALALREGDDALWRWYDAPYRREFVRGKRWTLRPAAPARYDACLKGDDAACDAVLRSSTRVAPEPPVRTSARHSFVGVALELGGPDAFARLLDSRGRPLDERLSATAGVPIDSLAAVWQARVARAAPQRAGFGAGTAVSSIAWIFFFAFLSSRSTRWR